MRTFTDRVSVMDTVSAAHLYRAVIRGTDMSVYVDGALKIRGQNAFWKQAPTPAPFIQFGSNARYATGEAEWSTVRLGVRQAPAPVPANPLKVTISDSWEIPRDIKPKHIWERGG